MAEVIGILLEKGEEKKHSETFRTMEFVCVLKHTTQYPQHVTFQAMNARIDDLNKIPLGVEVKIDYELWGKKYKNKEGEEKYFNVINAYKIEMTYQKK